MKDLIEKLRENPDVVEFDCGNNISSFGFKKSVFYTNSYFKTPYLPRGFFVNAFNNTICARGYQKFCNLNEGEDNTMENLVKNLQFPVSVYNKENGYLGLIGWDDALGLVYTSKSRVDGDYAINFKRIINERYPDAIPLIEKLLRTNNYCLTFEVFAKFDPHIVDYREEDVVLLDIFKRDQSGEKLPYDMVCNFATNIGLKCKQIFAIINDGAGFTNFIDSRNIYIENQNREGFVLEDSAGYMFKLKLPWYVFWKQMRGIKDRVLKGKEIGLETFKTQLAYKFYSFLSILKKNNDSRINLDIISLRKIFLTGDK
jgi:tRNA splicing ligase